MTNTPTAKQRTKRFYHVTHKRNVDYIIVKGLVTSESEGSPRVWLCTRGKLSWAFKHLSEHHKWSTDDMTSVIVDLPMSLVYQLRHPRTGVYFSVVNIRPEFLTRGEQYVPSNLCHSVIPQESTLPTA